MGSSPKPPKPPPLPPPPPPPPTPVDPEVIERRDTTKGDAQKRLRAMRTILTSPQGLPSLNSSTSYRTLLGR